MKTGVLKEKPESPSNDIVWAFDLGNISGADQLRNAVNQLQTQLYAA